MTLQIRSYSSGECRLADPSPLLSNTVRAIQQRADGALWFGTDGGVSRFEPQSGQWRTFTTQQGLTDNWVRAIQQSADEALWFGTGGGVSRFEPQSGQWRTYTIAIQQGLDNWVQAIATGTAWWTTRSGPSSRVPMGRCGLASGTAG